jgi:hypothetical protein
MRKRSFAFSAEKLRKNYKTFENYVVHEKIRALNESTNNPSTKINKTFENQVLEKKPSIISSAKKLEIHTTIKKHTKTSLQAASVARLYNGSIENQSKILIPLEKGPEFSESDDFKLYLSELKKLKGLESELEMNFDASRYWSTFAEVSLGFYYQLEEEIKAMSYMNASEVKTKQILEIFHRFTGYIREIIRVLKHKNLDNEASMLEILWRGNIKAIDTMLITHEAEKLYNHNITEERTRSIHEKYKEDLETQQKNYENHQIKLQTKIKDLESQLIELKQDNKNLEKKVNEKEGILQELNDIDRFEVLKDTSVMLMDLSEILEEVTEQKIARSQIFSNISLSKSDKVI